MSRIARFIFEWRTVLVAVLGSISIIVLADFVLVVLFGFQFRSSARFIFGSNDKETFLSLLFIEGALISGAGAVVASGMSESKITVPSQSSASSSYRVEKLLSQRTEQRKKAISTGIFLMLIGAPLLAIPFILSII